MKNTLIEYDNDDRYQPPPRYNLIELEKIIQEYDDVPNLLYALLIPHWFNKEILIALINKKISESSINITKIYHSIIELDFVKKINQGYSIDRETRHYILEKLWLEDAERFLYISGLASNYFSEKYFSDPKKAELRVEWLYHLFIFDSNGVKKELDRVKQQWHNIFYLSELQSLIENLQEHIKAERVCDERNEILNSHHKSASQILSNYYNNNTQSEVNRTRKSKSNTSIINNSNQKKQPSSIGILGAKLGMTQIFDKKSGRAISVTVVQAGPCTVTQVKTEATDGYASIQLGFDEVKEKALNRPELGHLEKSNAPPLRHLQEFRVDNTDPWRLGQEIKPDIFTVGQIIDVTGDSIGRGFAGWQKRHNFARGPMTHGSKNHREPGSTGAGTTPGRVFPGKKMAGRLGGKQITIKKLEVVQIDVERNVLLIKGSVPGKPGTLLRIVPEVKVGR